MLGPIVKAQLLAFLVYTTPSSLQHQLQGMGPDSPLKTAGEEEQQASLEELLPEPCPVLQQLVSFDAGVFATQLAF